MTEVSVAVLNTAPDHTTVPVIVAALIVGLVIVGVPASVYVPVILPARTGEVISAGLDAPPVTKLLLPSKSSLSFAVSALTSTLISSIVSVKFTTTGALEYAIYYLLS